MTSEEQKLNKCRNPWRWVCLVVAIIAALSLLWQGIIMVLAYMLTRNEAASIGIIGGADGPTAIFVATNPAPIGYTIIVSLIFFVLGGVGFYLLGHKKRK